MRSEIEAELLGVLASAAVASSMLDVHDVAGGRSRQAIGTPYGTHVSDAHARLDCVHARAFDSIRFFAELVDLIMVCIRTVGPLEIVLSVLSTR